MRAMLTVSSAAASTALTTLDAVKETIGITSTDDDAFIERAIRRTAEVIPKYLRRWPGDNGTPTIGRETIIETYRDEIGTEFLSLDRRPIVSITSIVENGSTLDPADYELDGQSGLLTRLWGDVKTGWNARKIVVTYVGGWLLPGDADRNLPQSIEDAAVMLIKLARFTKGRDSSLRSENILEGLYSYSLFAPSDTEEGIPPEAACLLDDYRNPLV